MSSTNWAGYADDNTKGNTYSTVTGKWSEPSVTCTSATSLAAFWVGIDGYTSASVEQDGTLAECYLGAAYYFSWWEMYPSNAIQVVGESVAAGDRITASVVKSGSSYTLKVTDSTHSANSFTTTQTCSSCADTSAEWIAEAPSGSSGVEPLSNFHSWTESSATVKSGSTTGVISTFPDDEITMINSSGATKAKTGPLNSSRQRVHRDLGAVLLVTPSSGAGPVRSLRPGPSRRRTPRSVVPPPGPAAPVRRKSTSTGTPVNLWLRGGVTASRDLGYGAGS